MIPPSCLFAPLVPNLHRGNWGGGSRCQGSAPHPALTWAFKRGQRTDTWVPPLGAAKQMAHARLVHFGVKTTP